MNSSAIILADGRSFTVLRARPEKKSRGLVVFLHGFPDTAWSFTAQLEAFAEAGFDCAAPFLPGYEQTSLRPDGNYHINVVAEDMMAVIRRLRRDMAEDLPLYLVGHDWGAITGYVMCGLFGNEIAKFAGLSVPHLGRLGRGILSNPVQVINSWYILFFQTPFLPELVIRQGRAGLIEKLWRDWSPGWEPGAALRRAQEVLSDPEVLKAALAYYRGLPDILSADGRQTLKLFTRGPLQVPVLALSGDLDGCIDPGFFRSQIQPENFAAGVTIRIVPTVGHFLQLEKPARINQILLDWLAD